MDHKLAIGVGAVLVAGVAVGLIVWLVALRGDSPPAQVKVPRDTPVPRDISVPVPTKAPIKYQTASSGINDLLEEVESGRSSVEDAASKAPLHYDSLVAVEIYVEGDVERLAETLEANGAALIGVDEGYIEAYVPLQYLGEAAALPGVVRMQPIVPPVEELDPPPQATVTPPGPAVEHGASAWHTAGYTGKGIKVGIIDTGFVGFTGLMGTELPGTVHARCYRENPFLPHTTNISDCEYESNHGTAVAEALFDMAPDVTFYVAQPRTKFQNRKTVDWMVSEGVSVINHSASTGWDGPGDGTSPFISSPLRIVDRAVDSGIVWVNSAGNEANLTWTGEYVDADADGWLEFTDDNETNRVLISDGEEFQAQLRWDDPSGWNYISVFKVSDLDLYLYDSSDKVVASSTDRQASGLSPPYEFLQYQGPRGIYSLRVAYREHRADQLDPPERIQLNVFKGAGPLERATAEGSISTPADSSNPGMLAVGAAAWDAWDNGAVRDYSSRGPTSDGRIKPDIVGADGGQSAAYEGVFTGTSQAAPHVAGLAALVRQRYPALSPSEVAQFLKDQAAVPGGVSVPDNEWGHGFAHLPADDLEVEATPEPTTPPTRGPQAAAFASVSAGRHHNCGLSTDGSVDCWGNDGVGQATPPEGQFASVSAGGAHTCGLRSDGTVDCWGFNDFGQATPPEGAFASVSTGSFHTCGLRADGTVTCRGDGVVTTSLDGEFASVSAGGAHTCGVRSDGSVACWATWGNDHYGQATPPAGVSFASVSAGYVHTCGVTTAGDALCWGNDHYGQATPPATATPTQADPQWKRFIKPGVSENHNAYIPQISDFGGFDSYVDDGSFLVKLSGRPFENSVVGFRTWLYHEGSASYEVAVSGDDGVALYSNGEFVAGRGNAEDPASYGTLKLNNGWNKIEALVYNGPWAVSLKLEPVLRTIGVVDADAYEGAPTPALGSTIADTYDFPTEPLGGDRVFLNSGTLNGQRITSSNSFLSVMPGQAISGTVNLMVANDHGGHTVFPVEATPTWGDHQSGYWDVPISVPSYGAARRDVTIDLTAPSTPGAYAVIFAAQAEFSGGYITSATHWPSGSPRWNNGDDIAGWSASQIDFAIANGYLRAHQHGSGVDFAHFGAAAVKIIVP